MPPETHIFGSRFIDQIKRANIGVRRKSRLFAQSYGDIGATCTATKVPAVQRFTQRILLSFAASMKGMSVHSGDTTKAHIQSATSLEMDVYVLPRKERNISPDSVLKVVKPLNGIPQLGRHLYPTYTDHRTSKLGLVRSRPYHCLLFKREPGTLTGMAILQVDDRLIVGSKTFLDLEEQAAKSFLSKPRKPVAQDQTVFNDIHISQLKNGALHITQPENIGKLETAISEKEFARQRALAHYIGVNHGPDVCGSVQQIALGGRLVVKKQHNDLKRAIQQLKTTRNDGLGFVLVDIESGRVYIISGASFTNALGMRSQLGYAALMADAQLRANVIHYESNRCHRVSKSVAAAEVHALVLAFEFGYIISDALE